MSTEGILKAVETLIPTIRARRADIEQGRRLPRDLVDQLIATDLFTIGVPRALGGVEAGPLEIAQVIETIAAADGSTGWCAMIGVSSNHALGYMNEPGAKEVKTDLTIPTSAIAAPIGAAVPVDGGYRVSGRWPFASGITHSDRVWAGCLVMEDGKPRMTPHGPQIIHAWMPITDVEVHDTWYVSGMCGTGSNDISATDVFVPAAHIFALFDPSGHRREPLYQLDGVGFFVSLVASVSLGIARGALEELKELAQTKMPALSSVVLADKTTAAIQIARAEAELMGARALLRSSLTDLWETALAGGMASLHQRAVLRAAGVQAVETAASVTQTANTLAGGSALYHSSSMQRHARDAEAVTHHFTVTPHVWEEAGRVFLGREPTVPIF